MRRRSTPGLPRRLYLLLAMTLAIGTWGPMPSAGAAPDDMILKYYAEVIRDGKGPICNGQPIKIRVVVKVDWSHYWNLDYNDAREMARKRALKVRRWVSGRVVGVGELKPNHRVGTFAGDIPGTAYFTFESKEPGLATLGFSIDLEQLNIPGKAPDFSRKYGMHAPDLQIKVVRCKFDISTLGDWVVPGEASIQVSAWSDEMEVKADPAGGTFAGSGTINWDASVARVEDCGGALTIGSSRVDWSGTMDENGQLNLTGTYLPAVASLDVTCARGGETTGGNMQFDLTPDPVQVSVNSSGGTLRQAHVLEGPEAISGNMTVIVIPKEDQAAAFDVDDSASAWLAGLFGNLPGLNYIRLSVEPGSR